VIREPPDLGSLAGNLTGTGMADLQTNPDAVEALGHGIGRQIVTGGPLLERVRSQIFSRASGNFGNLDGLLIVREQPEDMGTSQRANAGRLESGMLDGITSTRTEAVGVEQTDADPSSISFFKSHSVPSADDVDLVAGRVATVLALLGAEGSFGVKSTADRLLPDLLTPVSVTPALPRGGQSGGGGGNGGGNAGHNVQSGGGQSGSGGKQKPAG
jgi:hypothetical protein